jgi:GxxExxY protein
LFLPTLLKMPVSLPISIERIDQKKFGEIDFAVMRHAFECQRELGRLCEEEIYQRDLVSRLHAEGIGALAEVPVLVTHRDFMKRYWLDLVVAECGIYEIKTAVALGPEHEAQLLNYLFLCEIERGKLINFRSGKVESRFVNAMICAEARRKFSVNLERWRARESRDGMFCEIVLELVKEWGWGLEVALYTEALIHFMGGESMVAKRLPSKRGEVLLGNQLFHLLDEQTGFRVTALEEGLEAYERQLSCLLKVAPLRRMNWVNIGRGRIRLRTIERA